MRGADTGIDFGLQVAGRWNEVELLASRYQHQVGNVGEHNLRGVEHRVKRCRFALRSEGWGAIDLIPGSEFSESRQSRRRLLLGGQGEDLFASFESLLIGYDRSNAVVLEPWWLESEQHTEAVVGRSRPVRGGPVAKEQLDGLENARVGGILAGTLAGLAQRRSRAGQAGFEADDDVGVERDSAGGVVDRSLHVFGIVAVLFTPGGYVHAGRGL